MFLLVSGRHICVPQKDTHMASLYKTLQIWIKHFSEYLARKEVYRAENWQQCLHVSSPFPLRFSTLFIERFDFYF